MRREHDSAQPARDVQLAPRVHLRNQRVPHVVCAANEPRLFLPVPLVNLVNTHDGEYVIVRVGQHNLTVELETGWRVDGKREGNGKQQAVAEAHLFKHAPVIPVTHETADGGEAPWDKKR